MLRKALRGSLKATIFEGYFCTGNNTFKLVFILVQRLFLIDSRMLEAGSFLRPLYHCPHLGYLATPKLVENMFVKYLTMSLACWRP